MKNENPPWLFGLLSIPYGLYNSVVVMVVPFLLRKQGVSVDRIAGIVALASSPAVWYLLWSPVVDLGWRRRTWVLVSTVGAAACAIASIVASPHSLILVTTLLFTGSAVSMLTSSANGALLTMLSPAVRGRAGGWYQAGNIGAGTMGGGAALWLAGRASLLTVGLATATALVLPALAALWIVEKPIEKLPAAQHFASVFRDMVQVIRTPATWIGLVFFLSPVGSAAVSNLVSSLGPDYHASDNLVLWVSGLGGGLLAAIGSLLGGYICDRMNRMVAYAVAGLLSVPFSLWMGFGPATPFTYAVGFSAYSISAGVAYAAFTALELEVLGGGRRAAGTAYSFLTASSNIPISYMTYLDGVGYKSGGARGLMTVDAAANGVIAILLLIFARVVGSRWRAKVTAPE